MFQMKSLKVLSLLAILVLLAGLFTFSASADGIYANYALNGDANNTTIFYVSSYGNASITLRQNGKGTMKQTSKWDSSTRYSLLYGMYNVTYSGAYENGSVVMKDEECKLTLRYSGIYTITVTPYTLNEINTVLSADHTTTNWMYTSTGWSAVPAWSIGGASNCVYYANGGNVTAAPVIPTATPKPSGTTPTLSIYNANYPTNLTQGSNFSLTGIISTNVGSITKVTGEIYNASGVKVKSINMYPYAATYNLSNYSSFSTNMHFDQLTPGSYTYKLTATATNGAVSNSATLVQAGFYVSGIITAAPATPTPAPVERTPYLTISNANYPGNLARGLTFYLRGTVSTDVGSITKVTGEILNSYGTVVKTYTVYPYQSSYSLESYSSFSVNLGFNTLAVGTYTYRLTASATNGSKSTTQTLVQAGFNVYNNITAAPVTPVPVTAPPTIPPVTAPPTPVIPAPVISGNSFNNPGSLEEGTGFNPAGYVYCDIGQITELNCSVYNSKGALVLSGTVYPYASSCTLGSYSEITGMKFSSLTAGNYTYKVSATAWNDSRSTVTTVYSKGFVVRQKPQPVEHYVVVYPSDYDTQFKPGTAKNPDNEKRYENLFKIMDDDVKTSFLWLIYQSEYKDEVPDFSFSFPGSSISSIGIRNGYLQGSWDNYEENARVYKFDVVITDASGRQYTETIKLNDTYTKEYQMLDLSRTYTDVVSIDLSTVEVKIGKKSTYSCYLTDVQFYTKE